MKTLAALCAALLSTTALALPPQFAEVKLGHGVRLTDAGGKTLYTFEKDEKGVPTCVDDCAKLHPPLLAPADAMPADDWAIVALADGSQQWSYRNQPLYTYARDGYPGAVFGEGEGWNAVFQPIATPPGVTIGKVLQGQVLTSAAGLTIYTSDRACTGACLDTHTLVAAPWAGKGIGDFTLVVREDGINQWAFRGKPLFLSAADQRAGDVKGATDGWQPVVLQPAPPLPGWVKVVGSDGGELLADPRGHTLYAYDVDRNSQKIIYNRGEDCFGECITVSWAPVTADKEEAPIGDWSVIKSEHGGLQWAHRGQPLYTSKLETRPGDLSGISMRRHRAWRPIMRHIPSLQGPSPNG